MKIEVFVFTCKYLDNMCNEDESAELVLYHPMKHMTIKEFSLFSLRKAYLKEVNNMCKLFEIPKDLKRNSVLYLQMKQVWNDYKKNIVKETIEFPLIEKYRV